MVNTVVQYCRDTMKAGVQGNSQPEPKHMMFHGAGGPGKSIVVKLCTQWAQKIIQTVGSNLDQPFLLETSRTNLKSSSIADNTSLNAYDGLM